MHPCILCLFLLVMPCLQATFESADSICDDKIRQWLYDRKKHADPKRKRSRKKQRGKMLNVDTLDGNTPKRHTRSTRHSKRVDLEEERKVFSPVASSMVLTPVVQRVKHNNKVKRAKQKQKENNPMMVRKTVCLLPALPVCLSLARLLFYLTHPLFCFYLMCHVQVRKFFLRELRQKSKKLIAKRDKQRIDAYKNGLRISLPTEIELWGAREARLLAIISGSAGLSNAVLLLRECPDPPVEMDPDTDEESKQTETKITETTTSRINHKQTNTKDSTDPTVRMWNSSDSGHISFFS